MSVLHDWYPGDPTLEFFAIIAIGVALLSTLAWATALCQPRNPAARHLVLLWALFGCLAMPALAALFSVLGFTILSIPLFPLRPSEPDRSPTAINQFPVALPPGSAAEPHARLISSHLEPTGLPRTSEETREKESSRQAPSIPAPIPSARTRPEPQPGRAVRVAAWPLTYRQAATLFLVGWGCGSVLLLLRFARSCLMVRRLQRSARPLLEPSLHCLLAEVAELLGMVQRPQVFVSHHTTAPLAVGFRKSVIILPSRLIGVVTSDEMRDVLVHEAAHLHRRDPQTVFIQELARVLFWPIVPVHGLLGELARAREELCDNHVLQCRDAVSYGETLLHLAELSLEGRPQMAAVGILQWKGELERRIAGFLDQGRSTMTRSNRWVAGIVALTFISGGAVTSATRLITVNSKSAGVAAGVPTSKEAQLGVRDDAKPDLAAGRTMLVHVLGPDGRPMSGVKIHRGVWTRKRIPNRNMKYVSDENGEARVDVPKGVYIFRLWARAKGHVPLFAHWEEEEKPEESLPPEFTVRLQTGTVIGGIVRNTDGQPIKGVSVDVMLERGGQVEGRTTPDMWLSEGETPITDAEGRWTLDNIPPSLDLNLRLKFTHPDYVSDREWGESQDHQGVDLKALRSRKATISMRGGLLATGIVSDPQGNPVPGAVVVRGDDPYMEVGSQEVRTDEQGRYQFPPLPSGPLNITVMAQGWMPTLRKVEIGPGMKPFDFHLEPGKDVRIRFVDSAGMPVPGVYVGIDKWRGGKSLYNHRHPDVIDTRIPGEADQNGLFRWSWAPGDAVTYQFYKDGFVRHEATLAASTGEHIVTLSQVLRISGKVTDAATGRPIANVTAIPVAESAPGRLFTERNGLRTFTDGTYTIEGGRYHADTSYRVRIEAAGYRSALSDAVRPGTPSTTRDFQLVPAESLEGRVIDGQGNPVKDARVYLATSSQLLMNNVWENDDGVGPFQRLVTSSEGRFAFPAQFERYTIVAVHDFGYAEVTHESNQQPGELVLKKWAKIEGRLLQSGQPVPETWVRFQTLRLLGGVSPRIQDRMVVKTDRTGHFLFSRVPPIKGSLQAQLSVWRDSALTSSESVPLDLQPGEHRVVDLGGKGTSIKGRVILSGDAASKIDLHKSLNWLLRREPGIEPPAEIRALGSRPATAGTMPGPRRTREWSSSRVCTPTSSCSIRKDGSRSTVCRPATMILH